MAKHILADVCDCKRAGEIFLVSPDVIEIREDWNARTDFSGEEELMDYIEHNGVPGVLEVTKTADKRLILNDGERRLRAVRKLLDKGVEIKGVPVIVAKKGTSEIDLYLSHMTRNAGKPFTPLEEASCYRRLILWGFDPKSISERTGKSVSHVRNRLDLASASPEVQEAVLAGEVTVSAAQKVVKEADGSVADQRAKLNKAKKKKKSNKLIVAMKDGYTKKTGNKTLCCDPIEHLFNAQQFMDALEQHGFDPDTLRISIELKEEVEDL